MVQYKLKKQKIMKLKTYNATNSRSISTGEVTLRVNKKAGLFSFSKEATVFYGMKAGDTLTIVNDEDSPKDWYFIIYDSGDGFALRIQDGAASFNCSHVAKALLDSLKINKAAGFKLAKQPETVDGINYYAILTACPLGIK